MGVIIDEFEIVLDSQENSETEKSNTEATAARSANTLKPHDITSIHEEHTLRCERVRAH